LTSTGNKHFNENFSLPEDIREYAQIVLDTNDYNNIARHISP
jgi:hypothetical protein